MLFFFFSSRRRHTRCSRDWSSDVCSSDLDSSLEVTWEDWNLVLDTNLRGSFFVSQAVARGMIARGYGRIINIGSVTSVAGYEIGRASCRERGEISGVAVSLKKKKKRIR